MDNFLKCKVSCVRKRLVSIIFLCDFVLRIILHSIIYEIYGKPFLQLIIFDFSYPYFEKNNMSENT